jgi:hypothetical protein
MNLRYLYRIRVTDENVNLDEVATRMHNPSHKQLAAPRGLAYIVIMINIVKENYNAAITTRR